MVPNDLLPDELPELTILHCVRYACYRYFSKTVRDKGLKMLLKFKFS